MGLQTSIDAPRAKFKSATALSANWMVYIAHASVVVLLYIVSPVDSWINVRLNACIFRKGILVHFTLYLPL